MSNTCALLYCHGGGDEFFSMMTKDLAYSEMFDVVSHGPKCGSSGLKIVDPGSPDSSLLYLKITNPPCGGQMPAMFGLTLDDREKSQIREWIAMGAKND